jgi:hypothetical protein
MRKGLRVLPPSTGGSILISDPGGTPVDDRRRKRFTHQRCIRFVNLVPIQKRHLSAHAGVLARRPSSTWPRYACGCKLAASLA